MSKWGTYYGKTYSRWRKDFEKVVPEAGSTITGPVLVISNFCVKRPKTTKRKWPRGDIDNYEKALWDALTKKGYWSDDDVILESRSFKQFDDGDGKIVVEIHKL